MKKWLGVVVLVFSMFMLSGCFLKSDNQKLFNSGLLAVKEDNKWGYINNKGETVIPFKYDEAYAFKDGYALVSFGTDSMIIDNKGEVVITKKTNQLIRDHETGLVISINDDDKYSLIDYKGEALTNKLYDFIGYFSENIGVIELDNLYGFINIEGEVIVEPKYENYSEFSQGLAAVEKEGKWGYIDKEGKTKIEFLYDNASSFDKYNRARVYDQESEKYKLIDLEGNKVIEADEIMMYGGPLYRVYENDNYYVYNFQGEKISSKAFSAIYYMDNYFINGKEADGDNLNIWFQDDGNIFHSGKSIDTDFFTTNYRSLMFEVPEDYFVYVKENNALQLHTKNKTYNLTGERLTQFISKEKFIVMRDHKYGIIDKNNKVVVEFLYDYLGKFTDKYYIYEVNNKYGIMNKDYKIIVNAKYDQIQHLLISP